MEKMILAKYIKKFFLKTYYAQYCTRTCGNMEDIIAKGQSSFLPSLPALPHRHSAMSPKCERNCAPRVYSHHHCNRSPSKTNKTLLHARSDILACLTAHNPPSHKLGLSILWA